MLKAAQGAAPDAVVVAGHPFCEREYLEMNPDVRAAVRTGQFASGRRHFEECGIKEGRIGRAPRGLARSEFFGRRRLDLSALPSFRAEHFPYEGPYPWLDQSDWTDLVEARVARGVLAEADAALCRKWANDGYLILDRCVDAATLDRAWAAYDRAIAEGRVTPPPSPPSDPQPERCLDVHVLIPEFCAIMRHPEVLRIIRLLMDREPAPFQTIASHKGSQQREHSDSIHMTTYPLGYLTAGWTAFEDIHPDSGPLVYYPGSHRLPYVFSKDVGIDDSDFKQNGYKSYHERYEPKILELLTTHRLQPKHFHAKRGDVLLWHANLIHGGSRRNDLARSRHALVSHYFVQGAVTYHDLSGALAREHTGTCLVRP